MSEPTRFLPNWIDSYMEYTRRSEPPKLFHKWCAISAIAAVLQRKCKLDWGPISLFPNLYIVLIAPPGRARKGTAMSFSRSMLQPLDIPFASESTTRESLIRALKEAERASPLPDGTTLTHSSLTIFSPELTVFLGYNNVQLLGDLTDWFDCAFRWTYRTKTQGTDIINGVFVNILGATTPDMLRSALPQDAIGGGLTSRIIFVFEETKDHLEPFPMLSREDTILGEKLKSDLSVINRLAGNFTVSEDFLEAWGDWYMNNSEKTPFGHFHTHVFDGYIERRPTQLLKLSMIMSANRTDTLNITSQDFLASLDLLTETEKKMPHALGGIGTGEHSELTYRVLKLLQLFPHTLEEVRQKFIYDSTQESLSSVINQLQESGLITVEHKIGGSVLSVTKKGANLG